MKLNNMRGMPRLLCAALTLALFGACMPSKAIRDWDNAAAADTVPAYEALIRKFPDDKKYVEKAKERIDELEWLETCKYDTALSYSGYIRKFPRGNHLKEARKLACRRAEGISNIQLAYNFLEQNTSCENVSELRANIEKWEFELAKSEKAPEYAYFFLLKYPASAFRSEATALLDDKLFAATAQFTGKYPLSAYLGLFPAGKHSAEARAQLSAQPLEQAAGSGDAGDLVKRVLKDDDLSRKMACAVSYAAKLRAPGAAPEDGDKVRNKLYGLAKGQNSCDVFSGVLPAAPDSAALNSALAGFSGLIDERQKLGAVHTVIKQRNSILSDSSKVGERLRDDLETDELTSAILGVEALGGLNLEIPEKGSAAAKEALEEFKSMKSQSEINLAAAETLFGKLDEKYRAASFYIAWSFAKLPAEVSK